MKNLIAGLAVALMPSGIWADTISVEKARFFGPLEIMSPYKTEVQNMKGENFKFSNLISHNTDLTRRASLSTQWIVRGHSFSADSTTQKTTLSALSFQVLAKRYTKANIVVNKIHNYQLYVNGSATNGRDLRLQPGVAEVSLICLTEGTAKDSFDISLTGTNLKGIQVNPEGKLPYSLKDMVYGEHYSSVALSPTGKYLVTTSYNMKEDGTADYTTVITEVATGKVIFRPMTSMQLSWFPHRDVLYYTRNGSHGKQLLAFDPATQQESVVADCIPNGGFTISPTEDYLIFSRTQEGKRSNNALKRLYEPNDRQSGWRNRNYLMKYDLKTGLVQQLTFGERSAYLNDISEDGKKLLVTYSTMDTRRLPFSRTTVVSIDAMSGHVDSLLVDTPFIAGVSFSPDTKQLLVKASPDAFNGIGREVKPEQTPNSFDYRLYLYDLAKRTVKPLLPQFNAAVGNVQWSATNRMIYFKATDECNESLYRLNPETSEVTRFSLPISYVQGYSIALQQKNPRAVFYGQTGERAREMFTCILDKPTPKAQRIGHINFDELYPNVAIGKCQDWNFRTSRGDTVKGFYFLPPDFDPAKKYPMLVYYYGGCTPTAKILEFHYPLQVFASQGYIVYVCEPSGAIGFGQEFAARHVNTWGQYSGDDIIEGTKAFIREHPYVNAQKVGCMGASYGGFMTQYLQTRTDIFAAAVSHAGISNITSYWGGGYWGYTYGQIAQYGSYPWNNPDLYTKQSPLFNADKIKTPLLLLHGTVDTNVPTNESQQLFTALRILGRPVSYIQVDGENHVITNHDKRKVWQEAIFAWFAYWLKDEPEWWTTLYPDDKFGQDTLPSAKK